MAAYSRMLRKDAGFAQKKEDTENYSKSPRRAWCTSPPKVDICSTSLNFCKKINLKKARKRCYKIIIENDSRATSVLKKLRVKLLKAFLTLQL